ncbi:MAG: hypothetical protein HZA50_07640 [Planctomycetes bacterium]|nr:hypothetical protein [Planctomycetota bacterium]
MAFMPILHEHFAEVGDYNLPAGRRECLGGPGEQVKTVNPLLQIADSFNSIFGAFLTCRVRAALKRVKII